MFVSPRIVKTATNEDRLYNETIKKKIPIQNITMKLDNTFTDSEENPDEEKIGSWLPENILNKLRNLVNIFFIFLRFFNPNY